MPRRLRCYKQLQHSKLLTQFVFKMSAFRSHTCMKTRASLPDGRVRNALIAIQFVCQDTLTQFVDLFDPPFADFLLHY